MSEERSREEFEAAYAEEGLAAVAESLGIERAELRKKMVSGIRAKRDGPRYSFGPYQMAWSMWQASRTALVVDLPEPRGDMHLDYQKNMRARCRKAIEDAGIKVSPCSD